MSVCASCHFLEDAGTPPTNIGPDLDDAFRAARQVGMQDDQFAGVVKRWIRIAQLPMPRNLVTGQDADDVAAYVAKVAGTQPESGVRPARAADSRDPRPAAAADRGLMRLEGARVIVTGASRGIGRAVAEAVAAEGGRLVVTATRRENLDGARSPGCASAAPRPTAWRSTSPTRSPCAPRRPRPSRPWGGWRAW